MRSIIYILILIFTWFHSCKKSEYSSYEINKQNLEKDTIVRQSALLLLSPDMIDINELKKKNGEEDFYTIADDANYYISKIQNMTENKIYQTKQKVIKFPSENYTYNKGSSNDKWIIIDYIKGKQPKIYSLVEYYSFLNNSEIKNYTENDDYLSYNNDSYFIKDIDINNDGIKDKVVSSQKNMGDDLLLFLNDGKSNYSLALKTINFSEDGGFIIDDIIPSKKTSKDVFYIQTYFDGADGAIKQQYISYQNGKWYLSKTVYITSNWRNNVNKEYHCEIKQNISLDDKNIFEKLNPMPDESEWDKVCKEN